MLKKSARVEKILELLRVSRQLTNQKNVCLFLGMCSCNSQEHENNESLMYVLGYICLNDPCVNLKFSEQNFGASNWMKEGI